jgi:predicted branched-subunit amino acid permease
MSAPLPETSRSPAVAGFLLGVRTAATSVFAFVITVTYIGFGALCHDYGFSVGWSMLSTLLQWAGPAQVILVTALGGGTAAIETAVAVGLSSVRLLPMVVALLPMVKMDRTRPWQLIIPVHFMAVSVWIEATRHAPDIPREQRIGFCNGIGTTLLSMGVICTGIGYYLQGVLPLAFGAAAMFITPISFLTSALRGARLLMEKAALVLGLTVGPLLVWNKVEFDLLWTGVIGGTLAYGIHRVQRMRSAAS